MMLALSDKLRAQGDFGRRSLRSDERTEITQQGTRINAGGDLTLTSGADQTFQVASLASGGDLTLEAGGDIVFEAVKDFEQEARHKNSSDWAWRSAKGEGFSAETVRMSELVAAGELAIQAAGQIRIDVPQIDRLTVSQTIEQLVEQQPQLAWLKEMEARGEIDWRQVKAVHDSFKYSDSGIGAGLAVVVAIVVTVLTWGAASAAVGSAAGAGVGTGTAMAAAGGGVAAGWANVAATAAITSMASNAAINTINSKGDLGQALKLTFSDDALKGYVTAALAAGITSGVIDKAFAGETNPVTGTTAGHNLNTLSGVGNFAAHQASRAAVSAALDAAINGGSFEEKLAAALTSAAVHTVSAAAFNQVGNLGLDNGSIEKIAIKALVGGLISQAATGDFASGALAAGANEALVEQLAGLVDHDPQLLGMASQLVGAVSAGLTGGDARLAADIAGYDTAYNYLSHSQISQKREELANCKSIAECNAVEEKWRIIDQQQTAEALVCLSNGSCSSVMMSIETLKQTRDQLQAECTYFCTADALASLKELNGYFLPNGDINQASLRTGKLDLSRLVKSGINLAGSLAGVGTGTILTTAGGALVLAPEPTGVSKAAGAVTTATGMTMLADSSYGVYSSVVNLYRATQGNAVYLPDSGSGWLADTLAPGNQTVQDIAQIGSLGLALASGRVYVGTTLKYGGSAYAQHAPATINGMLDAYAAVPYGAYRFALIPNAGPGTSTASKLLNLTQSAQSISSSHDSIYRLTSSQSRQEQQK